MGQSFDTFQLGRHKAYADSYKRLTRRRKYCRRVGRLMGDVQCFGHEPPDPRRRSPRSAHIVPATKALADPVRPQCALGFAIPCSSTVRQATAWRVPDRFLATGQTIAGVRPFPLARTVPPDRTREVGKLDALGVKRVEHAHNATLNTIDRTITETLLAHGRHNHGEMNPIVLPFRVAHRCIHGTGGLSSRTLPGAEIAAACGCSARCSESRSRVCSVGPFNSARRARSAGFGVYPLTSIPIEAACSHTSRQKRRVPTRECVSTPSPAPDPSWKQQCLYECAS